jgi:hypothetical protein
MAISIQDNTSKCQIQVEIQLTDLQTARTAEASIRSLVSERMVYLSRKKPSNPDCNDRMYWNSSKSQKREVEYNRNQTSKLENRLLWSSSHDILELRRISQTLKIHKYVILHIGLHIIQVDEFFTWVVFNRDSSETPDVTSASPSLLTTTSTVCFSDPSL